MEIVIRRVLVSEEAVEEFTHLVSGGDSIFIVGPRYSGRSWLLKYLEASLKARGLNPVGIKFSNEVPELEASAVQRIREQLKISWEGPESISGLFERLEGEHRAQQRPIVLLLSNIDGLERETARRFLSQVRLAVNAHPRWLTAVISGESHVVSLITGPNSELNCGYEYILQGMAKPLFLRELERWSARLGIRFSAGVAEGEKIWALTGGNFTLVRRFLHAVLDDAVAAGTGGVWTVSAAEVDEGFDRLLSGGHAGAAFFQHAGEVVASSPQNWDLLLNLLKYDQVTAESATPHLFELGGIVVVRDGIMKFSSPLMANYIERQFGTRRRGDLEALAGNFDRAFQLYRSGGPGSARPLNFEDELVVTSVVRRLSSAFRQSEFQKLESWLENGVQLVLGFGRVSKLTYREGVGWTPTRESEDFPDKFSSYLRALAPIPGQIASLGDEPGIYGYVVTVSRDWHVYRSDSAIAVWEPPDLHSINRPRAALLHELLQAFSDAHKDALQAQRNRWLERLGARLAHTTTSVLAGLFVQLTDPDDVLRQAATRLTARETPFERVAYVKVNPTDGLASVVFSEPPVERPMLDREWIERMLDHEQVEMFSGKAFPGPDPAQNDGAHYVVPIQTDGWGRGLLLLEVGTGASIGLIEPVQAFADHLNAALRQSERVALVSEALNRIADPVLLFDPLGRHLFANAPAKTLLRLGSDYSREWRTEPSELDSDTYGDLMGYVEKAISQGRRVVSFIDRIAGMPYRGIVVSDVLKYRSGRPAGVLVHIPDQQYYAEMLRALQVLEDAADEDAALARLVEIFQQQGHAGIRVYRLDEAGTRLKPYKCFDAREDVMRQFEEVLLPSKSEDWFTWQAISHRRPCVFEFSERDHGQTFYTARGLEVIRISNPAEAAKLNKLPGEYWVDFPIMRGDIVTGKITVTCDEHLSPERLEMLRVFSGVVGRVLDHVRSRKTEAEQVSRVTRDGLRQELLEAMSCAAPILDSMESIQVALPDVDEAVRAVEKQIRAAFQEMLNGLTTGERTACSI